MSKPVATLILNRNLPQVSDDIGDHLLKWNSDVTDVYVIESGSDSDKLSKYCKFWANWPEAMENGLRYTRGFNYGLLELEKLQPYDHYFMVVGDASFFPEPTIEILLNEITKWPKLGIISPISTEWGEHKVVPPDATRCVWLATQVAWLFKSTYLDLIKEKENPSILNYVYDGENFRGYDGETELVIKAYLNDYAVALTSKTRIREREDLTDQNADVMKTERTQIHRKMMYEEGLAWMKEKYNFDSKWEMRHWAKKEYHEFFKRNPEYVDLRATDDATQSDLGRHIPKVLRRPGRLLIDALKRLGSPESHDADQKPRQ